MSQDEQKRDSNDSGTPGQDAGSDDGKRSSSPPSGGQNDGDSNDDKQEKKPDPAKRKRAMIIFAVVLVVAALGGFFYWLHARNFESTDDAQIDGHIAPVAARVDGTVVRVYVDDNTYVHQGDPLVELDRRDQQVNLDQQTAQLQQASADLNAERPNVQVTAAQTFSNTQAAAADVTSAEAVLKSSQADYAKAVADAVSGHTDRDEAIVNEARYRQLLTKEEVSRQEYDRYAADAKNKTAVATQKDNAGTSAAHNIEQKRADLTKAQARLSEYRRTSRSLVDTRKANVESKLANVANSKATLEEADLKLSYTRVTAPATGIIMRRSAEMGTRLNAGQQILTIVDTTSLWVTANFKETQLKFMHPNERATLHVDALGRDLRGTVESFGGSTGALDSVLPPENATGNYVKVVARIPVRIRIDPNQDGADRLRPGMSVEAKVGIER